ncbi:IclR family transcriptional regulator [Paraburkholderia strydomiana]|uniref:IclR family transcriptional regulator n=1 Tax=Paraburkholderia strydomiana TaxID=1245417 RepID=UPI0035B56E02
MLERAFSVIRALAARSEGSRMTNVARTVGLRQGTVHRILQALIAERVVEQDERTKLYRLRVDFFVLAAEAGNPSNLRTLCRPALLRLCGSLGETIFLMGRSSFDVVCLDVCEGPYQIRSFTAGIGDRVALGIGQASLAILAFLPEAEREEIIRFNVPRIRAYGPLDEVYLRTAIEQVRQAGYSATNSGLIDGMAGVAVPMFDRSGTAVAALSVGALASRLGAERLPMVVELLRRQAAAIAPNINPFDAALHLPTQRSGHVLTSRWFDIEYGRSAQAFARASTSNETA